MSLSLLLYWVVAGSECTARVLDSPEHLEKRHYVKENLKLSFDWTFLGVVQTYQHSTILQNPHLKHHAHWTAQEGIDLTS